MYKRQGEKVYVEGSIEYRSWQDREGQTRYTTEIRGNELILLGGRGAAGEAPFTQSAPKAAAAAGGTGGAGKAGGKEEDFGDFPDALDGEDDDLPF